MKIISTFIALSFAGMALAASSKPMTPSSGSDTIVPTVSRAMDESNVDTLKNMIAVVEKKLAQRKNAVGGSFSLNVGYGILCHNLALYGAKKGNRGFAEKSYERLRSILAEPSFPDSLKSTAMPYMGSARTLMGDENGNPVNKVKFTNDGIAILNDAVERYGKISFIPRFMRANVFFSLPDFFNKEAAARKDYHYLEDCFLSASTKPDSGIMAFVYLNTGNSFKKNRDMKKAMEYWKKAISIAPLSTAAQEATKLIALFGE